MFNSALKAAPAWYFLKCHESTVELLVAYQAYYPPEKVVSPKTYETMEDVRANEKLRLKLGEILPISSANQLLLVALW
jgi:hypothetical protein